MYRYNGVNSHLLKYWRTKIRHGYVHPDVELADDVLNGCLDMVEEIEDSIQFSFPHWSSRHSSSEIHSQFGFCQFGKGNIMRLVQI